MFKTLFFALSVSVLLLNGCSRSDYYTAADNRGRYITEQKKIITDARLHMFDKAMDAAGKTDTPLDDFIVYVTYNNQISRDGHSSIAMPVIKPPADGPDYMREAGHFLMPFVPWYFTGKMVSDGYRAMRDLAEPRYQTGGGPLNIYDSYNSPTMQAGRDGSISGASHVTTDSHDSIPVDGGGAEIEGGLE